MRTILRGTYYDECPHGGDEAECPTCKVRRYSDRPEREYDINDVDDDE